MLDDSSEAASFAPCKDLVRMYCSHCLPNDDIGELRQEVTKSPEMVSETIKNCVHSFDLGGGVEVGREVSTRHQSF